MSKRRVVTDMWMLSPDCCIFLESAVIWPERYSNY